MRNLLIQLMVVCLAIQLSACSDPVHAPSTESLRVGVLPDEDAEALQDRYASLFEFLSRETGLTYELVIPASYDALLTQFSEGQVDLAYFGGATFVKANSKYGAIPLVMRDVDSQFTSVFLVAGDSPLTLETLKGKRFSFGSRLSTSGHFMPRHFLRHEQGITAEDYFSSIRYSGKHDRTAYWVRDGEVDAGVANSEIIQTMLVDGRLGSEDIRTIWITPPYVDYVWAAHPQISQAQRERIQHAFLKLSIDDPQHKAVLSKLGADAFYPASTNDFSVLKQVMANIDVM